MKIFLFLFFIAIISNNQKNEPIEIIKCVLSNEKLKNDLNSLKFQIENLIKEGNYSNLISLLKIFSMVEEAKSCFKNPSQSIKNEEIVLKEKENDFFSCIHDKIYYNITNLEVQECWDDLSLEKKIAIISGGVDVVDVLCRQTFSNCILQEEICSIVKMFVYSFEKYKL